MAFFWPLTTLFWAQCCADLCLYSDVTRILGGKAVWFAFVWDAACAGGGGPPPWSLSLPWRDWDPTSIRPPGLLTDPTILPMARDTAVRGRSWGGGVSWSCSRV